LKKGEKESGVSTAVNGTEKRTTSNAKGVQLYEKQRKEERIDLPNTAPDIQKRKSLGPFGK